MVSKVIRPTALEAWAVIRNKYMGLEQPVLHANNVEFDDDVLADYELELAAQIEQIDTNASAELAELLHTYEFPESITDWNLHDVRAYLNVIEGSEFEQLHLTAFLRVNNQGLLFDRIKPQEAKCAA